jgi:hypothetical protein
MLPDASTATPTGLMKVAAVPTAFVLPPALPPPARVITVALLGYTARMTLLPVSAITMAPDVGSMAKPLGV